MSSYKSIELCAGCGGLALGLEQAGLEHDLLVELEKWPCETLKTNRPKWNVVQDSIENVDYSTFAESNIDLVSGGIPCQSFSYAGKKKGLKDKRGSVFYQFKKCVNDVKPKMFLIENVRGFFSHEKGETFKLIKKELETLGYKVFYKVLNSNDYDVAQKRHRIFIIGIKDCYDIEFEFPTPVEKKLVLRDVLQNINTDDKHIGSQYNEKKKKVLKLVPPGGCWVNLPIEIQKSYMKKSFFSGGGKRGIARRISWDEPSLTLMTSPQQKQTERCHPDETRPFNVREYARIQSFPDDWKFKGPTTWLYKQIGNAVPVNLAKHVGLQIVKCLDKISEIENQL